MVVDVRDGEQDRMDLILHALADPTRRDIVQLVLREEHSVSNLARRYPMSFAAVQKHVAILERASLVTKHERGRERLVRGRIEAVRDVAVMFDQLETTWRARLDRFGDVLAEPDPVARRVGEPVETDKSTRTTSPKTAPKTPPKSTTKQGAKR
jgi:DNA-binding transcriptional ArsR family regulator